MTLHARAGQPAEARDLIDPAALERGYYTNRPDLADPNQRVSFGTSGHRGTPLNGTFTESHVLAIAQAVCDYRRDAGIDGPLFIGMDSHGASAAAQRSVLEVLAAHGVQARYQDHDGCTPTPVISHAILTHNRGRTSGLADGIIITPSHNPPADGGIKYNPPNGGPADTSITGVIQQRANELLAAGPDAIRRLPYEQALKTGPVRAFDFITPYVATLHEVIDMEAIRTAGLRIGVDPMGGASLAYWHPVAEQYGLNLEIVNDALDPRFAFMTLDHDGKIRMDCSSPYAMASMVQLKNRFDVAFGNDPDADRHGIVTPSSGLMNPNHFLAVAIDYLLTHRPDWPITAVIGKTMVSSSIIDRVVASRGRTLYEVPVGFKWFAPGLHDQSVCFGGEESAGASFLRRDASPWSTDKDGLLLGLLAAEITAVTGEDPGLYYRRLTKQFGAPCYTRIDAPATPAQKQAFKGLTPDAVTATTLAGDVITHRLTKAPGNNADIGGLKISTANGWFAARPSGTENIYKIYAESFIDEHHLQLIVREAQTIVTASLT